MSENHNAFRHMEVESQNDESKEDLEYEKRMEEVGDAFKQFRDKIAATSTPEHMTKLVEYLQRRAGQSPKEAGNQDPFKKTED